MQMMDAHIVPDVSYEVRLEPEGSVSLISGNGRDTLLLLLNSPVGQRNKLLVNDMMDGAWGEERMIEKTGEEEYDVVHATVALHPQGLRVTTDAGSVVFPRFDAERAGDVRFVRFYRAENAGNTLVSDLLPSDVVVSQIENHVLHRRLERLERLMTDDRSRAPLSDKQR